MSSRYRYRLEFTSHRDGGPARARPRHGKLLVFYFATEAKMFEVVERFGDAGHEPVELDNLWWRENGALAFSDPDGSRVVLMPKPVPLLG